MITVGDALQNDISERMRKRSAWRAVRSFSAEQLEGIASVRRTEFYFKSRPLLLAVQINETSQKAHLEKKKSTCFKKCQGFFYATDEDSKIAALSLEHL